MNEILFTILLLAAGFASFGLLFKAIHFFDQI